MRITVTWPAGATTVELRDTPSARAVWDALAIPYGPTPVSRGDECRLASAATVLGQVIGDARAVATVDPGDTVRVERAGPAE